MRIATVAAWLAALLALAPVDASAQGRGGQPGEFDFYVLALSWSPSYCAARGERADRTQCGGSKAFGFIVHGLWPQYERGFPSDCFVTGRNPTRAQVDGLLDIMPSPGLIRHEWRKHGTCSGLIPPDYFALIRDAYGKISIPADLQRTGDERDVSPAEVERAFIDANPGLKPAGIAVSCKGGALEEVRICFTRDLALRACGEIDRRACRASRVSMPAAGSR